MALLKCSCNYDLLVTETSHDLKALISQLFELDQISEHPTRPFALATNAVALAEAEHPDEIFAASLLKARWLRISADRDLCHPAVAIPEIRYLLSTAAKSDALGWEVALERSWLLAMEGDPDAAAHSICVVATRSDTPSEGVVQVGMAAAILVLRHGSRLSNGLVSRLRSTHLKSQRAVTLPREHLYFEVARYAVEVVLGMSANPEALTSTLVSFCNGESAATLPVYVSLLQLSEVLGPQGMHSELLEVELAVASSGGPGELRSAAFAMAFHTAARRSSLSDFKRVSQLAGSQRQSIDATLPEEGQAPALVHVLLAEAEAALDLAGSTGEAEATEAEVIAMDSMDRLVKAYGATRWPAVAQEEKGVFERAIQSLAVRHRSMADEVATRNLMDVSLSGEVPSAPPRHPASRRPGGFGDVGAPSSSLDPPSATKPEAKEPIRSPQTSHPRQVGVLAESIFASACASLGWIVSKIPQESDYGIDFRIEPVFDRQVPGIEFFAQVKGTAQNPDSLAPVVSIRSETAAYWRAKLVPIAVVLINVHDSTIRYGWFDGTDATDSGGVTIKLGELFPGFLVETLQTYYESIRTDAVSSAALDSMLEAAAAFTYSLADDTIRSHYPHLIEQGEARYSDSKFTVGQVERQIRLMLMSHAISTLRHPSPQLPELLDAPIDRIRREIITLVDSFTVSTVLDRTKDSGLRDHEGNKVPVAASRILTDVYDELRPHLAFLGSRLTMQLSMARSNLIRRHMAEILGRPLDDSCE